MLMLHISPWALAAAGTKWPHAKAKKLRCGGSTLPSYMLTPTFIWHERGVEIVHRIVSGKACV